MKKSLENWNHLWKKKDSFHTQCLWWWQLTYIWPYDLLRQALLIREHSRVAHVYVVHICRCVCVLSTCRKSQHLESKQVKHEKNSAVFVPNDLMWLWLWLSVFVLTLYYHLLRMCAVCFDASAWFAFKHNCTNISYKILLYILMRRHVFMCISANQLFSRCFFCHSRVGFYHSYSHIHMIRVACIKTQSTFYT